MNDHWNVLYQVSVFYVDRKSKMATTAGHRLTLDPMGKCSNMNIMRCGVNVNETTTPKSNCIRNAFFSETINQTTAGLSLTLDPMGKMFQRANLIEAGLYMNVHWKVLYKV